MKKIALILALIIVAFTCFYACAPNNNDNEQPNQPQLNIINKEDLTVILHAGGSLDNKLLLNCQEAFYHYYASGFRYFEYDFKLSNDGKIIATHSWEHLSNGYEGISYEQFTDLKLDGGYTPVNEEWLANMLLEYPDVTVIADAKMETTLLDGEVIKRLYQLGQEHNFDISNRIIPEVFSIEMWQAIKDTTNFNRHLFSRYKEYYSIQTVLDNFPTDKFVGIALDYSYLDGYYKDSIPLFQQKGYKIFMFGIGSAQDVLSAISIGADTVYVDTESAIPN